MMNCDRRTLFRSFFAAEKGRLGSRHLGVMGFNGCFEFRNQASELFQIVCFMCSVENPSLNCIVHAPLAKLIQKVTGQQSQFIGVIEGKVEVTHDGTVE